MPKPAQKRTKPKPSARGPARPRQSTEQLYKEQETIFHSVPALIWYKDRDNIILKANRPAAESMGLTVQALEGKSTYDLYPQPEAAKYHRDDLEVIESGVPKLGIVEPYTTTSGEKLWMKTDKIPYRDETGRIIGVIVLAIDITGVKRAEEEIKVALREKDLLLKEVHHRVKNNLQVISSLFDLQIDEMKDAKLRQVLLKNQQRVRAISLVHEMLYRSRELSRIDFTEYLQNLSNFLSQMYEAVERKIAIIVEIDNVYLDINTAIPCGLIINEVLTNSLKHAFPKGSKGKIRISFDHRKGPDEYHLCIKDNGCGLKNPADMLKKKSLGMEIIKALANQLGGKLDFRNDRGMVFDLSFKPGQTTATGGDFYV